MWQVFAVAVGGALGSAARYGVSLLLVTRLDGSKIPWATFAVNAGGSFFLGFLTAIALKPNSLSPTIRLMLTTGFCGGLTTYSTFNLETIKLIEDGDLGLAAANVGATFAVCLVAGFIGLAVGRAIFPAN